MKHFLKKTIIFCLLISTLQLIIGYQSYDNFDELEKLDTHLYNSDIFFFGSSVNWYSDKSDKDKRHISQILDSLQQKNVYGISSGAYHLEIFKDFFNYILKSKSEPDLLIFEINLRSFSPEWNKRPDYQFEREKLILNKGTFKYFEKPLSIFKYYQLASISKDEFYSTPIFMGENKVGYVKDFILTTSKDTSEQIRMKFIFHYLYSLNYTNEKIKAIQQIIELSEDSKINVLFFISPIDFTTGEKCLPNKFVSLTTQNIDFIKQIIIKNNVDVLDLSYSLTPDYFTYEAVPNEHLKDKGRYFVAKEISEWIDSNIE